MAEEERKLNRSDRRHVQKYNKLYPSKLPEPEDIVLTAVDLLLDNNVDLKICKQELENYKNALDNSQTKLKLFRVYRSVGLSEEAIRRMEISSIPIQNDYDPKTTAILAFHEADLRQFHAAKQLIFFLRGKLDKKKRFFPDDMEFWLELLQDREIPLVDLLTETVRTRKESVDLISLQMEWLNDRATKVVLTPENTTEPDVQATTEQILDESSLKVRDPFLLDGWQLYWSTHYWSINPNHLVQISTDSRTEALKDLQGISRGEVMIKPGSILRAVEFHLSKDVIQRALATRMKYGPPEMRDWIKIKRGRDRILLQVVDTEKAIVFAGNRDTIYRKN